MRKEEFEEKHPRRNPFHKLRLVLPSTLLPSHIPYILLHNRQVCQLCPSLAFICSCVVSVWMWVDGGDLYHLSCKQLHFMKLEIIILYTALAFFF